MLDPILAAQREMVVGRNKELEELWCRTGTILRN